MDSNDRSTGSDEVYEPPAVVEVGSVSGLTGQDGSPDADDFTTDDN
jgi:hypothetical protein